MSDVTIQKQEIIDDSAGMHCPEDALPGCDQTPDHDIRRRNAFSIRINAALEQFDSGRTEIKCVGDSSFNDVCNGDEECFKDENFFANYSKGLPHDENGEVDNDAYLKLLCALRTGRSEDFDAIEIGCKSDGTEFTSRFSLAISNDVTMEANICRRLVNPQSGLAFDLEGADSHRLAIKPAPAFQSAEAAAEMAEIYWMALARDIPFSEYNTSEIIKEAVIDLKRYDIFSTVSEENLFRGDFEGEQVGPYISQFMYLDIPFGAQIISPKIRTVLPIDEGGKDFMTDFKSWLNIQNGYNPTEEDAIDTGPRVFIRNGRDLGQYVHIDVLYQAYFNAMLILLQMPSLANDRSGIKAEFDVNNPYDGSTPSPNQEGFGTFGGPHIATLVTEVATRALKAVWYQKWRVHRRLRPEEFAGRIDVQARGGKGARDYGIDKSLFDPGNIGVSGLLKKVFEHNKKLNLRFSRDNDGSYLLPMAFPEGSPVHPSYGAGHATVAGACVTILKAFFNGEKNITDYCAPVMPSKNGLCLEPYTGADIDQMTVNGELNKLAANIAIGRNHAGVHWRSDYRESLLLGEQVAIQLLKDNSTTYNEIFKGFKLRTFCGEDITV